MQKTGKNCLVFQAVAKGMKALGGGGLQITPQTKKDETSPSEMENS